MTGRIFAALCIVLMVASCARVSESRLNPFNWFGKSKNEAVAVAVDPYADTRPLVGQIVGMNVERIPGGAIIRATGLPPRQGFFDGELVPTNGELPEDGVLTYEFRAASPQFQTRVSTQQSREIIVGHFVSDQTLDGVKAIRVVGFANAVVSRR